MKNLIRTIALILWFHVLPPAGGMRGAAQPEAKSLWSIVEQKSGVKKPLTFISTSEKPGSYRIVSDTIYYSDEPNNLGSVYAVARLAEELFDAVMIRPGNDGIIIQKFTGWQNLAITYRPNLARSSLINNNTDPGSKLWLWWHHIPTKPATGIEFWHQSNFRGLCLKYPQLGPKDRVVDSFTKPDITHPQFPEIVYNEWVLRGKPAYVNLFEIDGTNFWWASRYYPTPDYLNLGEKERFEVAVQSNIKRVVKPGDGSPRTKKDGRRYPLTESLNWAQAAIPVNNSYTGENLRFNLTAFYLRSYIAIREYFNRQGDTTVVFNVLAYSAYRCLPAGTYDLTRFNVYYTSPTAGAWTYEQMLMDVEEFVKWKRTGAKVIWRPNFILRPQARLIYDIVATYIQLTQPDGYQLTPYQIPTWPFGNGLDIYAVMRSMQDKPYSDYFKYVPPGWMQWHDSMILKSAKPLKDEDYL